MAGNDEDSALLARIAEQDRDAFELLYRRYYTKLFQFVMQTVRSREVAEEVVDDTLFAVWRTSVSFQGRSTVSTWIFGIAHRQALNALRRQSRRPDIGSLVSFSDDAQESDDRHEPTRILATSQINHQLVDAIQALSIDHQAVIQLAALGHNATEISEIVQSSPATVRTRLFYARKKLKTMVAALDDSVAQAKTGTHNE